MKKKYFAPEIEEIKVEEPVLLAMNDGTTENVSGCPTQQCNEDGCPLHGLG